jgi:WW domain-containing oxidoreductase
MVGRCSKNLLPMIRISITPVSGGLSLDGRSYLLTGCNSGLGFETLRVLTLRGARVIAAARTLDKARAACASV